MFFPAHFLVLGRRVLLRNIVRLVCLTAIALKSVGMVAAPPPPVQPVPEPALLALAREKFEPLSRAEEELFRAAQEGREAFVLTGDEKADNPATAANWPADRAVRAKCIAWVCTSPQASVLVTHRGLQLYGMRIDGELDLDNAEVKFQLHAVKCAFSNNISLSGARLRGLALFDCQTKRLYAAGAIFSSSVLLMDIKADGGVNLASTKISGDVNCRGAEFSNTLDASAASIEGAGRALDASAAKIDGSVLLSNGFKAEGEIYLAGATIGGNLDCDEARFLNATRPALDANGAKVEGSVWLRGGFKAEGEVNLVTARIGNNLECDGAQLSNPKGFSLNADGSKIEGRIFLRNGFRAQGQVCLAEVTTGLLQILRIGGADQMTLDLRLAKVETFWDDAGSWPKAGNLFLDGFRYERLYEKASFDADSRKKWLSLQRRDKFLPQPYEQLATVLRQMGHEREARLVTIEKNREQARFTSFPQQSWWWYNIFGRLIGYGYEPWRAFAASLAMILLGTWLFRLGSAHGLIGPTNENAYAKAPNGQVTGENGQPKILETYPVFNAFVYSLESFVPLLKLDQSANWRPNANRRSEVSIFHRRVPYSGRFLRGYLYFHIAAGWLLTSLWVGAITGLVKT